MGVKRHWIHNLRPKNTSNESNLLFFIKPNSPHLPIISIFSCHVLKCHELEKNVLLVFNCFTADNFDTEFLPGDF